MIIKDDHLMKESDEETLSKLRESVDRLELNDVSLMLSIMVDMITNMHYSIVNNSVAIEDLSSSVSTIDYFVDSLKGRIE